jgi:hypothetical protein
MSIPSSFLEFSRHLPYVDETVSIAQRVERVLSEGMLALEMACQTPYPRRPNFFLWTHKK